MSFVCGCRDTGRYWIGLKRDPNDSTKFVWDETGLVATYTNWDTSASEPTGAGDCVEMSFDGLWYTKDCTADSGFISYKPGGCLSRRRRADRGRAVTSNLATRRVSALL